MAKEDIRVGLIGCGGVMQWQHIPNLLKAGGVRFVGLTDAAPGAPEKAKEKFKELAGARIFSDYRAMLSECRPDAVIIGTPHALHFNQIKDSLNAGCHVLVEKPFVTGAKPAAALGALAKRKKKVLMISYQRHFDPMYRYMREQVRAGRIGKIQQVVAALGQDWLRGTKGSWRQDPKISEGGQFNDSGSHIVDVCLFITELQPKEVFAQFENRGARVDINGSAVVRLEGGALLSLNIGGNTPGFWETLTISGDKGAMFVHKGQLWIHEGGNTASKVEGFPGYHHVDTGFLKAVRGEGPNEGSADFVIRAVKLTEAAYKSAKTGKPVKIA